VSETSVYTYHLLKYNTENESSPFPLSKIKEIKDAKIFLDKGHGRGRMIYDPKGDPKTMSNNAKKLQKENKILLSNLQILKKENLNLIEEKLKKQKKE
ncbi:MAG: hypothetical protein QF616_09935, partial [Candidatus Marinimicrobia bacterium]|nr:hypothetical protein [Candidatus Neomarinimicrobiota bacterium]